MRMGGKAVLVTGGASGIGRGIAERFVEAGAAAAVFDINGEGARDAARQLNRHGRAIAIEGDAANEEHVKSAVHQTVDQLGGLDVLINNAAIEILAPADELSSAQWDRIMAVNLKGYFLFAKYAIPRMKGRGGAIVNISSVHAFISYPGEPAYDASKAGILGLTHTLAIDHGKDGIRVNAICPGYIDTPLLEQWLRTAPDREARMRSILGFHPLGRIGTPRDIAEAALFLASPAASFISGATLVVDGALSIVGH